MKIFVVALPIGNIHDLSPRAREALEKSEVILCEDTRKLKSLAQLCDLNLKAQIQSFPSYKEREWNWERFYTQSQNQNISIVSDAGTPLINDPGSELIKNSQERGIDIEAVPGPCAPILAYQWSGGFGIPLLFAGFVPKSQKTNFFENVDRVKSFIFFDTRYEILDTLDILEEKLKWNNKKIILAREMSKKHEQLLMGTVSEVKNKLSQLISTNKGVGELTLILEGNAVESTHTNTSSISLEELLKIRFGSDKEASKVLAKLSGKSSSNCYGEIQKCKQS
jgi:16S rRNA (cytidine1402-2'-O)-methyltransferase